MKKNIFAILLLMLFATTVMAQSESKKVNVGITVGPTIDWISVKTAGYTKGGALIGICYGVPLDVNLTGDENYYFSTGIKMEHVGGKLKYKDVQEGDVTRKYNAIFLSIPTGIKLKTPSFSDFVIAGHFGLSHAVALSSKKMDRIKVSDIEEKTLKKTKYEEGLFFKESLYAGIGLEYIIKNNSRASFMVNYSYAFTNYHNRKALSYFDNNERLKGNLNTVEFVFGIFF